MVIYCEDNGSDTNDFTYRESYSYDGQAVSAAKLHIEYTVSVVAGGNPAQALLLGLI